MTFKFLYQGKVEPLAIAAAAAVPLVSSWMPQAEIPVLPVPPLVHGDVFRPIDFVTVVVAAPDLISPSFPGPIFIPHPTPPSQLVWPLGIAVDRERFQTATIIKNVTLTEGDIITVYARRIEGSSVFFASDGSSLCITLLD